MTRLAPQSGRPAFLDVEAPIDQDRTRPGDDEGADDDKPQDAEVHPTNHVPDATAKVQLLDEQLAQLEQADEECDKDGKRGDGQVVENLPYRVGESPRISLRHEGAVSRVHQRHTGGEDQWQ